MVKYRAYRKNRTRPRRESFSLPGLIGEEPFLANELFGLFGSHLFDDRVMRERLPLNEKWKAIPVIDYYQDETLLMENA